MNRSEATAFIDSARNGVLTTLLKDGRPHSSPVVFGRTGENIEISCTWTRLKTKNLQRDPRASLCIIPKDGWHPYLTVEGKAALVEDPDGRMNLDLYRRVTGSEPEDLDEYLQTMKNDQRMIVRLSMDRMYPLSD
ncbi:MAG: PPOX class F420-dependent oxidoreductase [bacterium]|nr:PPOX class F420-dependent oxidoreductase [bacterium]